MSISRVGPLVFRGIEVAGYTLVEKLFHKPVISLADVPSDVSKLTPQWLTAALCGGVPGAEVTDVEVIRGDRGSTTRVESLCLTTTVRANVERFAQAVVDHGSLDI